MDGTQTEVATLVPHGNGVWAAPGARIVDRSGCKRLPIGDDSFVSAMGRSVLVDKTMLIADVLDSDSKVTLFCRPRRFGKTLNMTMLKAFFELPSESDPSARNLAPLFEGTSIWEAEGGRYRESQGAFPVVFINLNTVKRATWRESYGVLKSVIVAEYARHSYMAESLRLNVVQRGFLDRLLSGMASDDDYAVSLEALCRMLHAYHGKPVVLLIDEYDAPVMAGYSAANGGYYHEVVDFLKGWLTGALKGGGDFLAFACLTGVQRISKESIFSDLNNLSVSTALSVQFDERYGFTEAEVAALASYLGHSECVEELRTWYDGYRFGRVDAYNPWSVLSYFSQGCKPRDYWGNTSSNLVLGDLVRHADDASLADLYRLCEPGGVVWAPLDLGVVFPDMPGELPDAVWSMLYLAGYLTTDEPEHAGDELLDPYPLRIPNREVAVLYKNEIVSRFVEVAGGRDRYQRLHRALIAGDEEGFEGLLRDVVRSSTSCYDITSENSAHMLLLGLLYGVMGYDAPRSNLESGGGRFDIRLAPLGRRTGPYATNSAVPLVTIELKYLSRRDVPKDAGGLEEKLRSLAGESLTQIAERGYDEGPLPEPACGRLRWGIAFGGKDVAARCERVE